MSSRSMAGGAVQKPITEVVLVGGDFSICNPKKKQKRVLSAATKPKPKKAAAKPKRKPKPKVNRRPVRRLWGNGKGSFRTRGRHAAATVCGTVWLTEDRCDGTLIRVREGVVSVRDFVLRRTVLVRAGRSYLAPSRR